MQILIKLALLVLTFFLVFINPAYIGKVFYYSLFPILFLLVYLLYYISYTVKEKDVKAVSDEPILYSIFCSMVPLGSDGDFKRGLLVVTKTHLKLYQKSKGKDKPCKMIWSIPIEELDGLSVEPVLGGKKGFAFHLEHETIGFVCRKAEQEKDALIKALGWESQVEVGVEASSAPSFKDL